MKDKNDRKKPNSPGRDSQDIGEVRVSFNPGPDAEDRLRRAVSLMIKYATRGRQAANGDDANAEGRAEAEK